MTNASLEEEVIALVAEYSNHPAEKITPQTTLLGDIGIDGDDGDEILKRFMEKFQVDMSSIRPVHFGIEGFLPWAPLMWIHQAWVAHRDKSSTPVLVLRGIHSAAEFVAALPEGRIESGFFKGHRPERRGFESMPMLRRYVHADVETIESKRRAFARIGLSVTRQCGGWIGGIPTFALPDYSDP